MKLTILRFALASITAVTLVACGGGDDATPAGGPPVYVNTDGTTNVDSTVLDSSLSALPLEDLSQAEMASLAYMREEEKLAHDVYARLDSLWGSQVRVFGNIAQSEATHTEAVRQLLIRYNVPDPAAISTEGMFANVTLQQLYYDLVDQGAPSQVAALQVGALIEELDIFDIRSALELIDNKDIRLVYESLMKGSRNHLRSFVKTLTQQGEIYSPIYLSQEDFDAIVTTPIER
ncbi:MAG: DUF2202 domain-containing protein [Acidovorax sp.]|nr:DUF2202 domain-containing protein [Acidovorax sp.]